MDVACSMPVVFDWNSTGEQAMEPTPVQYERMARYFRDKRGHAGLSNHQVPSAMLHVAGHGGKWRGLPERFGHWHTVYPRLNRWLRNDGPDRVFEHRQRA